MKKCEFCYGEVQKAGECPRCGNVLYSGAATFIYGQTHKDSGICELRLTTKYLIVRRVSNAEFAGNVLGGAFGLLGALTTEAIKSNMKKTYAFYDLAELEKVIYPFHTHDRKNDLAFRFVRRDGSDFVLLFNQNGIAFSGKAARGFADALRKTGVRIENGAGNESAVYCAKPFVDLTTYSKYVCASVAAYLPLTDGQIAGAPLTAAGHQGSYSQQAATAQTQPAYGQPKAQPAAQPAAQPQTSGGWGDSWEAGTAEPRAAAQSAYGQAWQQPAHAPYSDDEEKTVPLFETSKPSYRVSAPYTAAAPSHVNAQNAPLTLFRCTACGAVYAPGTRFCGKCGGVVSAQARSVSDNDRTDKW